MFNSNRFYEELSKIIDMPNASNCKSFVINCDGPHSPTIATVVLYAKHGTGETITKRYKLVEDEDELGEGGVKSS